MNHTEFFRKMVGVPFLDGGRSWSSVDCWGVCTVGYWEVLGIELPLYGEISAKDLRRVSREVDAGKDGWRKMDVPQAMDVAVMRLPSSARVGHVGLYDGQGHILHAEKASGVALEDMRSPMIAARLVGFWRY